MSECMVRILSAGGSNQLSQLPASELPDCAGIVVNYNYFAETASYTLKIKV